MHTGPGLSLGGRAGHNEGVNRGIGLGVNHGGQGEPG
eukprot:CAMPEP_0174386426 /NCGR_PEP_ID=MMETSP0811_2-20130205/127268_1 /TAXON_ID=73025 ORGANISM="Eutreptiella gymnastica-like, Strain CCMP1594" /NCGR_SAMPLE_ID=MMETSP0811_2 /ASSEMBLY_ACC=CAM_ASM_000667 /LENGTH=36 /DNA_ID= /DNA_START= /DNA_END= /DNA_ORIENTATION=